MSGHSPIDKGTQIKSDLSDFGIYGLYILTREGLPLVERNYKDDTHTTFGSDSLLVAGFFSAIAKFASDKISGLLSDIGFHTIRLFFDFSEDLFFILVFDEMKLQGYPFTDIRTMCKGTTSQIKAIFESYFSEDSSEDEPTDIEMISQDMRKLERLRENFSRMYPQVDRILHKSFREVKALL
jgi:hypothetical protein